MTNTGSQRVLVLTASEIKRLLPLGKCIELMSEAFKDLCRGEFLQPLRTILRPPNARGVMAMMPTYHSGANPAYGLKAICFFHDNPTLGKDAHQGCMLLSSGETGELLSIMNATAITEIRTAAVSALATRILSRSDAAELAIIGSGVQARAHLHALSEVRSIKRARVFSPDASHLEELAFEMRTSLPFPIEACESAEAAVRGADLIVTATSARRPVIKREWISPGAHLNAIGTYAPQAREIDSATMAASRIFVDRRESTLNEAGDYLLAAQEGLIGPESIVAELGEVLLGQKEGRKSADEITLFKSLGLAMEDMACAEYLYEKSKASNAGRWIEV